MARHSIGIMICGSNQAPNCASGTANVDFNNSHLTRDTSNASRGIVVNNIVYDIHTNNWREGGRLIGWFGVKTAITSSEIGQHVIGLSQNVPINYTHTWPNEGWLIDAGVVNLHFAGYFTWNKGAADWRFIIFDEPLADEVRITPPQGLTVGFPTSFGGNISASISAWGKGNPTPMTGTPTSYPGAKYWNWAVDLLDASGNYLAHYANNYNENKTVSLPTNQFYTASALPSSSAATSSKYTLQPNKGYKLKVTVNNSFNQSVSKTSPIIYTLPPEPSVSITSIIYQPSSKNCNLTFSWSKPVDGGGLKESVYYSVYDTKGKYYKTNVLLKTNNAGNGSAMSGNITVTGLPPGEKYFVKVTVNQYKTDGTTVLNSSSKTVSNYAPVANAAFLGFDWDELRRTCTIRAEAPGAANCRIQAGYAPNSYTIGNKLTSGQVGTLVVKDLNHGSGQILYLQATPESSDGHQYLNEIAKISVPIPNPILGLVTPSCEDIERGVEKRYIVDFIEKKKGTTTCTPRWRNGDRVVYRIPCGDGTNPWRIKPVDGYDKYNGGG